MYQILKLEFNAVRGTRELCIWPRHIAYHLFVRYRAVTGYLAALLYLQSKQCVIGLASSDRLAPQIRTAKSGYHPLYRRGPCELGSSADQIARQL